MIKEIKVFLAAVMFFTRIPCPGGGGYSQDIFEESARYYPVIGWIVGGFSALVFYCAHFIFSVSISVFLSMVASIMITGAFHEDGFADVCDGFGGGGNKKKILEIMKDSRIGTYGGVGLVLILLGKFLALKEMNAALIPSVLFIGHAVSRFISSLVRYTHQYVRDDDSKVNFMAKRLSLKNLFLSAVFGLFPVFLLRNGAVFFLVVPVSIAEYFFARYTAKRIGGYTGDCLGAGQQLCEVTFYLSVTALWKFI